MIYFPRDGNVVCCQRCVVGMTDLFEELLSMFKVCFLLLLFQTALVLSGAETVLYRSASGVSVKSSETLRRLEHFVKEFFPQSPYPKSALTVDVAGRGTPPGEADTRSIVINVFKLERQELETLSKAGSAMLRAYGKVPENYKLPLFFCAAFRHRERSLANEARFLGNNRRLNAVEALARSGNLPDLRQVLDEAGVPADPVTAEWYDAHARVLLELLRLRGFKGTAEELLPAARKAALSGISEKELRTLLWNNFNLLPAEFLRKDLDALLQVTLPRVDHQGEANGLFDTVPLEKLPEKLLLHPRSREILKEYSARVAAGISSFPPGMRSSLRAFQESITRWSFAPENPAPCLQAAKELEKAYTLCCKRSAVLDEFHLSGVNAVRILALPAKENSRPGTLLGPRELQELRRYGEL